jgi:porphobilinogen synthase
MNIRPRRNRKSSAIRHMVEETKLGVENLIYPIFLKDGKNIKEEVSSLPNNFRWSIDKLLPEIEECMNLGIHTFDIFPAVDESLKDQVASYSYASDNFYLEAIRQIKARFPESVVMSDVAMDPYSSDGHDGLVIDGKIVNDETLPILAKMSVAQAQAGVDIIGPSDMMDGRIGAIRQALENKGHVHTQIMAYSAKYASSFYGPFRDAVGSAANLGKGNKKTYQMDPGNTNEALREVALDIAEGADMVMVKPGMPYLDVVRRVKDEFGVPTFAYQVSGEYAMLKAAAQNGWLDHDGVMMESLLAFKRAGADGVLTYFARDAARLLARA